MADATTPTANVAQTPIYGGSPLNQSYYGMTNTPDQYEVNAGVAAQPFYSNVNADGSVKANVAVDPTQSAAFNQMASEASSTAPSAWAALAQQQNTNATQTQKDQAAAQTQGSTDQSMESLMSHGGGTNSGAAALIANQGARTQMMNNQNINNQSQQNNLGIQSTDAQNKQTMLGQVASTETAAQATNAQTAAQDATNANLYAANRYNQQMSAYGAQQTAAGQTAAANNSGKK